MTSLDSLLGDPSTAGVWNLDPERSTVAFTSRSFWGLLPVKGKFTEISGDGQITRQAAVFGRLDIRAASLATGIGKRDDHLRSSDFFDADRFPDISVVVTALHPTSSDTADFRATLTVKTVTKPLGLPAGIGVIDANTVRISAKTTIDRTQWDVTGNLAGMVTRTVAVKADLVFVKSPS
ncbi:YceI family protein [Mycolicibacterium komossense]|uniref:YceI family protein n=1 Tax=Mycolicibacterium komossense TaxID=1779 RepID=A0ABT3CI55_9MYCO|nr:YceI family protein [Mycolicibacterium komossense]MCV7229127.1 YceI family protein [Mycolicibacterium komossense]